MISFAPIVSAAAWLMSSVRLAAPAAHAAPATSYASIADFCATTTCNPNVEAPLAIVTAAKGPVLEARVVGVTDSVTTECGLALRTRRGWFVHESIAACHISAGTARERLTMKPATVEPPRTPGGDVVVDVAYEASSETLDDKPPYTLWVRGLRQRGHVRCTVQASGDDVTCETKAR